MNLREGIELILSEYESASREDFGGHDLGVIMRDEIPQIIRKQIFDVERYSIKSSVGQGNWANCPWIALFDILITDTVRKGFYPVFLFKEDFTGLYLSLNQGITDVREKYKSDAKKALLTKAADYRAQLGNELTEFPDLEIDLCASSSSGLSAYYEKGNICAKFYKHDALPSNEEIIDDLCDMLRIYEILSYNETIPKTSNELEDDEQNHYFEDLRKFRQHKRIERNARLAKEVKRVQGTTCKVCKTNFEIIYGELGKGFIEAHHLTPISELVGQKVQLDPIKDFSVLCANCHRMIHRCDFPNDVERFRNQHYLQEKSQT